MTLDKLKTGQSARIRRVDDDGPLMQRLMAMGVLEGADVTLLRRALGGDPLELRVMDYVLSLRRSEAERIEVELHPARD